MDKILEKIDLNQRKIETPQVYNGQFGAPSTSTEATRIALEITRILTENGLISAAKRSVPQWIALDAAAEMFGYSVSRFYHVYKNLGLLPSRASKRKLRFSRADLERVLKERQKIGPGRPRRIAIKERI